MGKKKLNDCFSALLLQGCQPATTPGEGLRIFAMLIFQSSLAACRKNHINILNIQHVLEVLCRHALIRSNDTVDDRHQQIYIFDVGQFFSKFFPGPVELHFYGALRNT